MKIVNKEELDKWLFHHVVTLEHDAIAVKDDQGRNEYWEDTETGEIMKVEQIGRAHV